MTNYPGDRDDIQSIVPQEPNTELEAMIQAADRALAYGVDETNNIAFAAYNHNDVDYDEYVTLGDPRLKSIDRLRLLTEPGYPYYDISYCYGTLKDGRHVRISNTPMHLPRRNLKGALIQWAKDEGVYAKGLGLLDEGNWSILR